MTHPHPDEIQRAFDEARAPSERNQLGQFATPHELARQVLRLTLSYLPMGEPLHFLDPAIGTGSLYAALLSECEGYPIASAAGVEIDPAMSAAARRLWSATNLNVTGADFTSLTPGSTDLVNLLVANPPYVRHHHLSRDVKAVLARRVEDATGLKVSGLAGLYCHFLLLSRAWLTPGGVSAWLIPSEFMDVGYGNVVKRFLLEQVTLLRIHRANPAETQFDDALVSSAVVVFRNSPPPDGHEVSFTMGGTLDHPAIARLVDVPTLARQPKWTRFPHETRTPAKEGTPLGELFHVTRGIVTGCNEFFVVDAVQAARLPQACLTPVLPPPRHLPVDLVPARADGSPDLPNPRWLVTGRPEVVTQHPELERYLQSGVPDVSTGYLCSRRSPWYAQEVRAPAPLLCTYMGRGKSGRPFRFVLNQSNAVATNVYLLLYPKPTLRVDPRRIWHYLNHLDPSVLIREGRVYGGGLYKIEPSELARVHIPPSVLQVEDPAL